MFGFLADGPVSQRAAYEREVAQFLRPSADVGALTEADLAPPPAPVQRYLRVTGAIGQPRVRNFRARMHGRIREGHESRWMPFTAEQHHFHGEPARLFFIDASMLFVSVQVLHRYVGASAAMRANVLEHGLRRRRAFRTIADEPPRRRRPHAVWRYGAVTTTALHERPPLRRYACGIVESK